MEITVSPELEAIISKARDEAMRTGHYGLGVDHLVLGALRHSDNRFCKALGALGISMEELKEHIDAQVFRPSPVPFNDGGRIGLAHSALSALNLSIYEALKEGSSQPGPEHLLIAASRCGKCAFQDFLSSRGITTAMLEDAVAGKNVPQKARKAPLPDADDIARALEAELRRVMASGAYKSGMAS